MKSLRIVGIVAIAVVCLITSIDGFSQSSNATLSGTVSDAARALIPGVSVTATNTETNVVTTAVSNESGIYNISGLLPGVYTVSAELPGFQTQTFTDVRLGNAAQARLNFSSKTTMTISPRRLHARSDNTFSPPPPET